MAKFSLDHWCTYPGQVHHEMYVALIITRTYYSDHTVLCTAPLRYTISNFSTSSSSTLVKLDTVMQNVSYYVMHQEVQRLNSDIFLNLLNSTREPCVQILAVSKLHHCTFVTSLPLQSFTARVDHSRWSWF